MVIAFIHNLTTAALSSAITNTEAQTPEQLLKQLKDIAVPQAEGWQIPVGYWFVAAFIVLLVIIGIWLFIKRYHRNRALKAHKQIHAAFAQEYANIQQTYNNNNISPQEKHVLATQQLATLLRRIVMHLNFRQQTAALSGSDWIDFLAKNQPKNCDGLLTECVKNDLALGQYQPIKQPKNQSNYQPNNHASHNTDALFDYIGGWLKASKSAANKPTAAVDTPNL